MIQKGVYSYKAYSLTTVNNIRQYSLHLDIIWTFIVGPRKNSLNYYLSSPMPHVRGMMIMESQFVWFRILHSAFSRYVYFNHLQMIENPFDLS
jgi:hypothetical protein